MSIDLGGIVETSRGRQAKSRRAPETEAVGFLESGLELMSRMGKWCHKANAVVWLNVHRYELSLTSYEKYNYLDFL